MIFKIDSKSSIISDEIHFVVNEDGVCIAKFTDKKMADIFIRSLQCSICTSCGFCGPTRHAMQSRAPGCDCECHPEGYDPEDSTTWTK